MPILQGEDRNAAKTTEGFRKSLHIPATCSSDLVAALHVAQRLLTYVNTVMRLNYKRPRALLFDSLHDSTDVLTN